VQRISALAERFAPNNEWYLHVLNTMFELGGDIVSRSSAHNLMRLIGEGAGEDDEADKAFRTFSVNTYLKLLEKPVLSDTLVQAIAWVLGEYATLATVDGYSLEDITDLLCESMDRPLEEVSTRGYIVTALLKIASHHGMRGHSMNKLLRNYRSSCYTDLQQRCYEFDALCANPALMREVLPYDASFEDIAVDPSLPFLDAFVQERVRLGPKPHQDAAQRAGPRCGTVPNGDSKSGLNFVPYHAPPGAQPGPISGVSTSPTAPISSVTSAPAQALSRPEQPTLQVTGTRRWGPVQAEGPPVLTGTVSTVAGADQAHSLPSLQSNNETSGPSDTRLEHPPEKALTEREQMAAALFNGMNLVGPVARSNKVSVKPVVQEFLESNQNVTSASEPEPGPSNSFVDLLGSPDLVSQSPSASSVTPAGLGASMSMESQDILMLENDVLKAIPLPPLGPLPISAGEFGVKWGQLAAQRSVRFQTSLVSTSDLMVRMQSKLNTHHVETIGVESIAAGRVIDGDDPVLLHAKLDPPMLDILVRSRTPDLAVNACRLCGETLF